MEKKVSGILIEYEDGSRINIRDLKRKEYEEFLDDMLRIRSAYIALIAIKESDK